MNFNYNNEVDIDYTNIIDKVNCYSELLQLQWTVTVNINLCYQW